MVWWKVEKNKKWWKKKMVENKNIIVIKYNNVLRRCSFCVRFVFVWKLYITIVFVKENKIPKNYYPTDFCVRVKGGKVLNNGSGIKILKLICK